MKKLLVLLLILICVGAVYASSPDEEYDSGLITYTEVPKTISVTLPTDFDRFTDKVEVAHYDSAGTIKKYMGWNGNLQINGVTLWSFMGFSDAGGTIYDAAIGGEVSESSGSGKWIDATLFFIPGENSVYFYHYNEGDGIGVKVRYYKGVQSASTGADQMLGDVQQAVDEANALAEQYGYEAPDYDFDIPEYDIPEVPTYDPSDYEVDVEDTTVEVDTTVDVVEEPVEVEPEVIEEGPTEEELFIANFEGYWPTSSYGGDPVGYWNEWYEFSQGEVDRASKRIVAGKSVTIAKDVTDIAATLATGGGVLDGLTVVGELYSIGSTIYGEDSVEAANDAAEWIGILALAREGWKNRDELKAAVSVGVDSIQAARGISTAAKVTDSVDDMADAAKGVSAAESIGLNVFGAIVDYAVINDVAATTKYDAFEMNEHAKKAFLAKHLVDYWTKYNNGQLTMEDAQTMMEMEIMFFLVQKKEISVRKQYWEYQKGFVDSLFSWIPLIKEVTAHENIRELEELESMSQTEINDRLSAEKLIYT